jgi:hypothetical protein
MSGNDNVAARTPEAPVALEEVGASLLREARASDQGRSSLTLTPQEGASLKQNLVALEQGRALEPAHWNGPATVQVLSGGVSLSSAGGPLGAGMWATVSEDDDIRAHTDTVLLLTVSVPTP